MARIKPEAAVKTSPYHNVGMIPRGPRSATAAPGYQDVLDQDVWSSLVLQHGGFGEQTIFTNPIGQTIPSLRGAAITASTNTWHLTYSKLTTNLNKAGELGNKLGDVSTRAIHITLEPAGWTTSAVPSSNYRAYGLTPADVQEVLFKTYFELRLGRKPYIEGPLFRFPSGGGPYGSVATTNTNSLVGTYTNGIPGQARRLTLPIGIERSDTLEVVVGVGQGASYTFVTTTGDGQPGLAYITLVTNAATEVR